MNLRGTTNARLKVIIPMLSSANHTSRRHIHMMLCQNLTEQAYTLRSA